MSSIRISNRTFARALIVSCVLNLIAWSAIGVLWRPSIGISNTPLGRIVRLARAVPLPPSPKPPATPIKTPPVVHPRLPRQSRQHEHHAAAVAVVVAPVPAQAKSSGGSHPAPRVAVRVAPRSAPKATPRPAPVQVAAPPAPETATVVIKSHDARLHTVIVAAAPALPAVLGPVAAPSGQAAGTGSGGQGTGQGAGAGSGQGNGGGGGSPGLFGLGDLGGGDLHVVYVLDVSLSMSSRIGRARDELETSLDALGPSESFDIVAFGTGAYSLGREPVPANAMNKRRAARFLDDIDLLGGTNLQYAIGRALHEPGINTIVVLTDGVPTEGETNIDQLIAWVRNNNPNHVRIYTIGLVGQDPNGIVAPFEATRLLEQIARDSGGRSKLATVGDADPD